MKYFSMFSGIGGFEYGIEKATEGRWKCVGHSEIDKYATAVYTLHYPKIGNYGDATKIDPAILPEFDLLCGGFPCQAFSIAGNRQGFKDTRGTLFFEIARILEFKKPKYCFLENVKGLLNHGQGKTFGTILSTLDALGYNVQWMVLNSKFHGVAQNRERVFIIGSIRELPPPKILPFKETARKIPEVCDRKRESETEPKLKYIGAVMAEKNNKWLDDGKTFSRNFPQGQRVYSADGIGATLSGNAGGLGGKTGLYAMVSNATLCNINKRNCSREEVENVYRINKLRPKQAVRRLTPTECERLQGFPDDWTKTGMINQIETPISDTQRYKMLGNAVTTNVITAIARSWDANKF